MNLRSMISFVAFFAMIVSFLGYVGSLGIRVAPPADRTAFSMDVSDINNLELDSRVLLRGVSVGKVTGLESTISNATIHFYVDANYKVPRDSIVRLENLSALGESYIEIEPQSTGGPFYSDGEQIVSDSIRQPASISELGVTVVRVMNQLDPAQLNRVVGEANAGLPDPYRVLPNLERASKLLHNTTTSLNGQGKEVLANSQSLLENAGFVGPTLANATPSMRDIGPPLQLLWNTGIKIPIRLDAPGNIYVFGQFIQRIQKLLDARAPDIRVLTEPLTANINAIAASLRTIDTSQVLTNLLRAVPEDGVINLHVVDQGGHGLSPEAAGPPVPAGLPSPTPGDQAPQEERPVMEQEGQGGN